MQGFSSYQELFSLFSGVLFDLLFLEFDLHSSWAPITQINLIQHWNNEQGMKSEESCIFPLLPFFSAVIETINNFGSKESTVSECLDNQTQVFVTLFSAQNQMV